MLILSLHEFGETIMNVDEENHKSLSQEKPDLKIGTKPKKA